jgi:RNA polymerase sigma factor (sigma-70 family)
MSGRLLPFRSRRASAGLAGQAQLGSGRASRDLASQGLESLGDPAGAAAPLPDPPEALRFRVLIGPHVGAAYSLARYLARDPAAAEDIAQEALLKAFRNLGSLRGAPKPWLLAIVRNAYFDWRRAGDDRTVTGPAAEVALAETPDPSQETAEAQLIRQGDVDALRAAIEDVPEPFREALVLRDLEELSYRDIAEITGAPIGTVMSRLARARRMLGERMGVVKEAAP